LSPGGDEAGAPRLVGPTGGGITLGLARHSMGKPTNKNQKHEGGTLNKPETAGYGPGGGGRPPARGFRPCPPRLPAWISIWGGLCQAGGGTTGQAGQAATQ